MAEATYSAIIKACKASFRLLGNRFQISGTHHIPPTGGALLAVNHIGYVDFIYSGLAADIAGRRVRFMAKRELFDHRITGPLVRACRHISVDRADGEAALHTALSYLRDGEVVGIFPEATISRAMEIKELKTGAVRIAAAAGVPLIPVIVWGTQRLMTKDHPRDLKRGKAITILVGDPLPVTGEDPVAETAALKSAMEALLEQAVLTYPQAEPGSWWTPTRYGGSAPTLAEAAVLDAEERAARAAKRGDS